MNSFGTKLAILTSVFFLTLSCQTSFAKHKKVKQKKAKPAAAEIVYQGNLTAQLNSLVRTLDRNATIGVHVKSMKYGDTLYSHNERYTFVPASILKIVTAQTALMYLGSDYTFPTKLMTDAKNVSNGVVDGNIYLVHSGDPTLTFEDMTEMMVALKSLQIRQINGNVYIDDTAYDRVNYGPGWIWNDKRYCYAAPISASIINHNCLSFSVLPGKSVGHPANIIENPRFYYASIQNDVITKGPYSRSCYIHLTNNADGSISLSGCLPKGRFQQGVSTVINEVAEYNKSMMRDLFKRAGIQINGSVDLKAAPPGASVIAKHDSKPLSELITTMLKMSDNIIAGSIFKKIGAMYSRQPGSWENGSSAVSQILAQRIGLNTWRMNVLDGSGLSRYNQISPEQLMKILDFAYHNQATNYDFISALPIAGVDGTLKHRLQNVARRVRAKTGTMSGVVALAGYAVTRDKEPIAFVIIVNGRNGLGWKYRELEDKIVTAIAQYKRN